MFFAVNATCHYHRPHRQNQCAQIQCNDFRRELDLPSSISHKVKCIGRQVQFTAKIIALNFCICVLSVWSVNGGRSSSRRKSLHWFFVYWFCRCDRWVVAGRVHGENHCTGPTRPTGLQSTYMQKPNAMFLAVKSICHHPPTIPTKPIYRNPMQWFSP